MWMRPDAILDGQRRQTHHVGDDATHELAHLVAPSILPRIGRELFQVEGHALALGSTDMT